jgi:hypothetical protein
MVGLSGVDTVVLLGAVVGAWCFLCLVTALISLILVALALFHTTRYSDIHRTAAPDVCDRTKPCESAAETLT